MVKLTLCVFLLGLACLLQSGADAVAALRPESVHVATARKTNAYIRDGLIVGGDRAINDVVIKDIRRAANAGFERIVIDLQGNRDGESVALQRPPYYQVSVTPDEKRLVFNIWGNPKLALDAKRVANGFKRSSVVQGVELLPKLDDGVWTFVLNLKSGRPAEVFELADPIRIIVDIRTN